MHSGEFDARDRPRLDTDAAANTMTEMAPLGAPIELAVGQALHSRYAAAVVVDTYISYQATVAAGVESQGAYP